MWTFTYTKTTIGCHDIKILDVMAKAVIPVGVPFLVTLKLIDGRTCCPTSPLPKEKVGNS